jgi:DNA-binding transcriptional regulator YdaS (Cro superfamily)
MGHRSAYACAEDRLERVKTMTVEELRDAIMWPDSQKTVRLAASRRLHQVTTPDLFPSAAKGA